MGRLQVSHFDGFKPLRQLTRSRREVSSFIERSIARGEEIMGRELGQDEATERVRALEDIRRWDESNEFLLQHAFAGNDEAQGYPTPPSVGNPPSWIIGNPPSRIIRQEAQKRIQYLEELKDRLPLYDEPSGHPPARMEQMKSGVRNTIFIVHGHQDGPKQAVARYLQTITDLTPAILHELPKSGRTIIELLEQSAASAAFVVVLLTGDDEGGVRSSHQRHLRARQNVVFELGLFIGMLKRKNVAVLYEENVELPSDMNGVLYTPLDSTGAWKLSLGRELLAAGVAVDLNRAI
jgi:predicted nucleotide-binding protein